MATPTVYVICDQNCKFESMTKEQILTAIMQAVNEGTISDVDAGFITTVKTINGLPLKFFVGEQSAYDALTDEEKQNLFAIISNDTTKENLLAEIQRISDQAAGAENAVEALGAQMDELTAETARVLQGVLQTLSDIDSGEQPVGSAEKTDFTNNETWSFCTAETEIAEGTYEFVMRFTQGSSLTDNLQYRYSFGIITKIPYMRSTSPLVAITDTGALCFYWLEIGNSAALTDTPDNRVAVKRYNTETSTTEDVTADYIEKVTYRRIR